MDLNSRKNKINKYRRTFGKLLNELESFRKEINSVVAYQNNQILEDKVIFTEKIIRHVLRDLKKSIIVASNLNDK